MTDINGKTLFVTGGFRTGDMLSAGHGVTGFGRCRAVSGQPLSPDSFVPEGGVPPARPEAAE